MKKKTFGTLVEVSGLEFEYDIKNESLNQPMDVSKRFFYEASSSLTLYEPYFHLDKYYDLACPMAEYCFNLILSPKAEFYQSGVLIKLKNMPFGILKANLTSGAPTVIGLNDFSNDFGRNFYRGGIYSLDHQTTKDLVKLVRDKPFKHEWEEVNLEKISVKALRFPRNKYYLELENHLIKFS